MWSHSFYLGGFGPDPIARMTRGSFTVGLLAVFGFFTLSGLLITRSYEGSAGLGRYLWHRALRLFPAYWVCIFVVAFCVAPVIFWGQHHSLRGFLWSEEPPWRFVSANWFLILKQLNVSGPYPKLSYPDGLDGSLWTLQYEVLCYLALAAFGVAGIIKRSRSLVLLTYGSLLLISSGILFFRGMRPAPYEIQALELCTFFAAGACAYLWREYIPMNWFYAAISAIVISLSLPTPVYGIILPTCGAYITLFAAMKLPLLSIDRRMDLSYGIYIFAFPMQQLLAMYAFNKLGDRKSVV